MATPWRDSVLYPPPLGRGLIVTTLSGKMCFAIYRIAGGRGLYSMHVRGKEFRDLEPAKTYWIEIPPFNAEEAWRANDPEGYAEAQKKIQAFLQEQEAQKSNH